ncbi:hypothetical protein MD484_g4137, partial [Candolleomyces efflorescens]
MRVSGEKHSGKTELLGRLSNWRGEDGNSVVAAVFFFSFISGYPRRCSKSSLVPSIAYQIADNPLFGALGIEILNVWKERGHDLVQRRDLQHQFRELILGPLSRVEVKRKWPRVVVIDGLDHIRARDDRGNFDDVQSIKDQLEVLAALRTTCAECFPFRILVSGRPDNDFSEPSHSAFELTNPLSLNGQDDLPTPISLSLSTLSSNQTDGTTEPVWAYTLNQLAHHRESGFKQILMEDPEAAKWLWLFHDAQAGLPPFSQDTVYSSTFLINFLEVRDEKIDKLRLLLVPSSSDSDPFTFHDTSIFDFLDDESRAGESGLYVTKKERNTFYMSKYLHHWNVSSTS